MANLRPVSKLFRSIRQLAAYPASQSSNGSVVGFLNRVSLNSRPHQSFTTRKHESALFTQNRHLSSSSPKQSDKGTAESETITVTFVGKDGVEKVIKAPIGMSMLESAHQNNIELEGACEGCLACSTCHVIVMDEYYYKKLPEPTEDENDTLDLAFGLTETSRLGCQLIAKSEMHGIRLAIPSATRNAAVDGHVPKPQDN